MDDKWPVLPVRRHNKWCRRCTVAHAACAVSKAWASLHFRTCMDTLVAHENYYKHISFWIDSTWTAAEHSLTYALTGTPSVHTTSQLLPFELWRPTRCWRFCFLSQARSFFFVLTGSHPSFEDLLECALTPNINLHLNPTVSQTELEAPFYVMNKISAHTHTQ